MIKEAKPLRIVCERQSRSIAESDDAPHRKVLKAQGPDLDSQWAGIAAEYLAPCMPEESCWIVRAHKILGVWDASSAQWHKVWKEKNGPKDLMGPDGRIHLFFEYHTQAEGARLAEALRSSKPKAKLSPQD